MNNLENEIWTPIIEYNGLYEVSNYGRVKSLKRFNPKSGKHGMWYPDKILKLGEDKDGYNTVHLCKNGKRKLCKVHRIVLSSFDGDVKNLQVNHIDGDKKNNRLDNLEWVTCSDNIKHAHRIGLKTQSGSKNNGSKLIEEQVIKMCDFFKNTTYTNKQIANMFDLKSDETVRRIRNRTAWTHVTKNIDF